MGQSQESCIIEIRNAVDELLKRLFAWASEKSIDVVPDKVLLQLRVAASVIGQAEVPESCRPVATAVSRLYEEYRGYEAREHGKVRLESGSPAGSFWAAVIELANSRLGVDDPLVEVLEPVSVLLKQNVSYDQIARFIYGRKGVGPFMQASGCPDVGLIEKEAASPGSVLGQNWVPPWHQERIDREKAEMAEKIKVFERQRDNRRYDDPGTVESMLRDGCFIQQIEKGKGASREEILRVAQEIGVEAKDAPGYVARGVKVSHEEILEEILGDAGDESDGPPSASQSQSNSETDARIRELVIEMFTGNSQLGSADIAAELRKQGFHDVVTNKVSAIIGHHKKHLAKAAATAAT